MIFLISLFPIITYLLLITSLDGFSLCGTKKILKYISWGVVSCLACVTISRLISEGFSQRSGFVIIEEIVKALPIIVNVSRRKSAFFTETLTYGAAIGAGFSFVENIIYILANPEFAIGDAVLRGLGTSLVHIGCTALWGCGYLVIKHIFNNWSNIAATIPGLLAMIPPIGIHYLYNQFLLPEFIQMFIVIVVFLAMFLSMFKIDKKEIHTWLDECIANDIVLLGSMKEGKLQETSTGKYLLEAKEKFKPEVFFDICMFLSLYLELSIAAKSRVILNESGLDIPITEQEHRANKEKIRELVNLRKSIGKSGIMLLSPFINDKAKDKWVIKELL